ncbi:hypothetical protein B0H10DRAFT_1969498 [Mycena sp. CBHHK59/15]|nr:hypothetical protein B0H10DRAFT_1969498 [Mycena sp. CBHHK59/15]
MPSHTRSAKSEFTPTNVCGSSGAAASQHQAPPFICMQVQSRRALALCLNSALLAVRQAQLLFSESTCPIAIACREWVHGLSGSGACLELWPVLHPPRCQLTGDPPHPEHAKPCARDGSACSWRRDVTVMYQEVQTMWILQVSGREREHSRAHRKAMHMRNPACAASVASVVARVVVATCSVVLLGLGQPAGCGDGCGKWWLGGEAALMGYAGHAQDVTGVAAQETSGRQSSRACNKGSWLPAPSLIHSPARQTSTTMMQRHWMPMTPGTLLPPLHLPHNTKHRSEDPNLTDMAMWQLWLWLQMDMGLEITDLPKQGLGFKINQVAANEILHATVNFKL